MSDCYADSCDGEDEDWTVKKIILKLGTQKLDVEKEKGLKLFLLWQLLHGVPDSSSLGCNKFSIGYQVGPCNIRFNR